MEKNNTHNFEGDAEIFRLTNDNSTFSMKNGFLSLVLNRNGEEISYDRVFLHRDFPFELEWQYISVVGEDSKEIGLIYDIGEFPIEANTLLRNELHRKYYTPTIKKILNLKERYGFSYWKVMLSNSCEVSFTVQDTYRQMTRSGEDSVYINDVNGNRFLIESISALDRKSYRRIELYL